MTQEELKTTKGEHKTTQEKLMKSQSEIITLLKNNKLNRT